MTRLPSLTGEQVVKALGKAGFQVLRQKGSHVYLKHADDGPLWFRCTRVSRLEEGLLEK